MRAPVITSIVGGMGAIEIAVLCDDMGDCV